MRIFRYGKLVDSIDHYYSDRGLIAVKKSIEKQEKNQYLTTVPAGFCDPPPSEGLRSLKPAAAAKARVWI